MKKLLIFFLVFNLSMVNLPNDRDSLKLTDDEIEYISLNGNIKTGIDPAFVPYEFINQDGVLSGIGADYLEIVGQKTGLNFEIMYGLSWQETYQKALDGEILVLPTVSKTSDREQYFNFSDAYYELTRVIVVSQDNTTIKDFGDLKNLTVAVQRSSSHHSFLFDYSEINLSLYNDNDVAISQVASGNEVAFLGSLATVSHIITTNGFTNLRLIAFESPEISGIHFAVNKDEALLLSIINKALRSITKSEKNTIHQKWISYQVETPLGPWFNILITTVSLFSIVLIVSLFWILKLRKENEKRKKIQIELENANNVKQHFLARMSHELRTPIHAINGMSYLLKNSGLNIKQNMYSERIAQASSVMLNIVDDILDYSKFTSGKIELENTSFNLDSVITNVLGVISLKISEKGIKFIYREDPLVSNGLIGDQYRLEQILINLLNNAVKFCNDTPVRLDIESLGIENNIQELKFTISDSGIGMTEKQVQALFTPFIQADSTISRRFGGTGLGLSIVKELVTVMGGSINVSSELSVGTSFCVILKLQIDSSKEHEEQEIISLIKKHQYKALIIGDDNIENNILVEYLQIVNIKVSIINGMNFLNLKLIDEKDYDIVLIDHDSSKLIYDKIKRKLKEYILKNNNLKTILIIPLLQQELYDSLEKSIINYGINKPVIPILLYETINNLCNDKNAIPLIKEVSYLENSDKVSILVVDDNFSNQIIANTILRSAGYNVYIAGDGETAIELSQKHHNIIKIILMDIHMPIMDGYETTQNILKFGYEFEIIAMTADIIPGVISKCKEYGINHYISKPFEPEKLVSLVNKINKDIFKKKYQKDSPIDFSLGLKYMGGDENLYISILEQFYEDNINNIFILKDFLNNGNYHDAKDLIHKMKSGTGSIGATKLFNISNDFQKVLEDQDLEKIITIGNSFYLEFDKLMETIKIKIEN